MIAAVVQSPRSFVMVTPTDWLKLQAGGRAQEASWSFTLERVGSSQCRLIARLRNGKPPTFMSMMTGRLFWEPMHVIMEQKMLRNIRNLSDRG